VLGFDDQNLDITGNVTNNGTLDLFNSFVGAGKLSIGGDYTGSGDVNGDGGVNTTLTVSGDLAASSGTIDMGGAALTTGSLSSSGGTINMAGGTLTVTGNLSPSGGTINMAGGTLTITGSLSPSGGTIDTGGGNINTSDFVNGGTIRLVGGTLTADGSSTESRNQGDLELGGGVLDVDHNFFNDSSGTLSYNESTLQFAANFQNSGSVSTSLTPIASLVRFDGGGITQRISGSNLTGSNGGFADVTVTDGSKVDPDPDNGKILVTGALTVKSNAQYGTDPDQAGPEDADLRYEGETFSVDGTLFADVVEFAAGNVGSSYTTVEGAVFAKVDIINNTAVEVGSSSFTVNGPVFVNSGNVLNVSNNGTTLELASDFQNNGTVEALGSGTIKFNGEGAETDCSLSGSDLECARTTGDPTDKNNIQEYAGASATYNALRIQDEDGDTDTTPDTKVKFSDSGSAVVVQSDLIIEEASLETIRPIELKNGNLDVRTDGSIDFKGDRLLTLSGSSPASVTTQSALEIATINMDKAGGTMTFNDPITVTDRLRMLGGTLEPASKLTIENVLQLGDPNDDNTSPVIDVDKGGGSVILVSDGSNDAYIEYVDSDDDGTNDGSITGPVLVQRTLSTANRSYLLSTPVGSVKPTFEGFLELSNDSDANDLWTQGIPNSDGDNAPSSAANVVFYDETIGGDQNTGFVAIGDMTNTIPSGKGFLTYVYGDDDFSGSTELDEETPKLIDLEVEPTTATSFVFENQSDVTLEGTDPDGDGYDNLSEPEDGWILLGNPYLATIDWDVFSSDATNLDGTVYVFDPSSGTYKTWDGSSGGVDEGHIAPLQGFFVKVSNEGTANLDIDDITNAQANTSGAFLKSSPQQEAQDRSIELHVETDDLERSTYVSFQDGGKVGKDRLDAYQLDAGSDLKMYSVRDGTAYASQSLPYDLSEEVALPVAVRAFGCENGQPASPTATMTWPAFENIPAGADLIITDMETGEEIDLRTQDQYTFDVAGSGECSTQTNQKSGASTQKPDFPAPSVVSHTAPKSSSYPTRFKLTIKPKGTLPVEFSSFTGSVADNAAKLEWTTATEQNNAGFQVQRKVDGSFQNIEGAFVEGAGTSEEPQSYSYRVEDLDAGQHTFRLKQVDVDGGSSFSKETTVKVGLDSQYELKAYPNPISEQATIKFAVKESQDVTVELYNTLGQRVQVLHQGSVPSSQTRTVSLQASDLSSGLYIVRMRGESFSTTKSVTVVR
jgi:hypothetical protein